MSRQLLRTAFKLLEVLGAIEAWEECVSTRDAPEPAVVLETSWELAGRLRMQIERLRRPETPDLVPDELLERASLLVERIGAQRGHDDLAEARQAVMDLTGVADESRALERILLDRLSPGEGGLTGRHRSTRALARRRPLNDRWALIFLDVSNSTQHQLRLGTEAWYSTQELLFKAIWDEFEGSDRLYYGHERGDLECWAAPAEAGGVELLCTLADHAHAVARSFSSARRRLLAGPGGTGGPIRLRVLVGVGEVLTDERGALAGDLVHRLSVLESQRYYVRPSATTITEQAWAELPEARRATMGGACLPPARLRGSEQRSILVRDPGGPARRGLRGIPDFDTSVQLVRDGGVSVPASYRLYDENETGAGLYVSDPPPDVPEQGEAVTLAWRDPVGLRVCKAVIVWVERGGGLLGVRKLASEGPIWISEKRDAAD